MMNSGCGKCHSSRPAKRRDIKHMWACVNWAVYGCGHTELLVHLLVCHEIRGRRNSRFEGFFPPKSLALCFIVVTCKRHYITKTSISIILWEDYYKQALLVNVSLGISPSLNEKAGDKWCWIILNSVLNSWKKKRVLNSTCRRSGTLKSRPLVCILYLVSCM